MIPKFLQKTLLPLLSLALCSGLLLSTPGCAYLFPTANNVKPDKPDNPEPPAPAPSDPFSAKPGMAKALQEDKVMRSQAILLYGIFAGAADYVQGLPNDTAETTTTIGRDKMPVMLDRVGWPVGKYPKVKAEIARIWVAMDFEASAKPLSDSAVKQKLLDTYRNMANGCKDAVGSTK